MSFEFSSPVFFISNSARMSSDLHSDFQISISLIHFRDISKNIVKYALSCDNKNVAEFGDPSLTFAKITCNLRILPYSCPFDFGLRVFPFFFESRRLRRFAARPVTRIRAHPGFTCVVERIDEERAPLRLHALRRAQFRSVHRFSRRKTVDCSRDIF